jgi:hypothetical protein
VLYCRCKKEVRSLLAFTGTQVQILTRRKALRWQLDFMLTCADVC